MGLNRCGQVDGRTGRTRPMRRGQADGRKRRGWGRIGANGRTGGLGGRANGRTRRMGERADGRVGLDLKGHIPRGPFHSWTPSSLASLEHECARCLGVQWSPVGFHINHPYLALGLPCFV